MKKRTLEQQFEELCIERIAEYRYYVNIDSFKKTERGSYPKDKPITLGYIGDVFDVIIEEEDKPPNRTSILIDENYLKDFKETAHELARLAESERRFKNRCSFSQNSLKGEIKSLSALTYAQIVGIGAYSLSNDNYQLPAAITGVLFGFFLGRFLGARTFDACIKDILPDEKNAENYAQLARSINENKK